MSQLKKMTGNDLKNTWELLSGSGYSDKAITYFLDKTNMGCLPDADQVTELTGPCGDTMRVYLKLENGRIKDAKIEVLGWDKVHARVRNMYSYGFLRSTLNSNHVKTCEFDLRAEISPGM